MFQALAYSREYEACASMRRMVMGESFDLMTFIRYAVVLMSSGRSFAECDHVGFYVFVP